MKLIDAIEQLIDQHERAASGLSPEETARDIMQVIVDHINAQDIPYQDKLRFVKIIEEEHS